MDMTRNGSEMEKGQAGTYVAKTDFPLYIVGIGASAGGLEALEQLFSHMPIRTGMGYVVIQHLSPDYKSLMVELLSKHTKMKVIRAQHDMAVTPDTIFLIPPGKTMTIYNGRLQLQEKNADIPVNLPIDMFLGSLARDRGDRSVAVILSGTGSDGTRGVRAVKEAGGMVMVQDESSAKFDGMPRSAIATGAADFIMQAQEIPSELCVYVERHMNRSMSAARNVMPADDDNLKSIFQLVKNQTGIDFSQYKHSTVIRRIQRRMDVTRIEEMPDYLQHLLHSPREVTQLCREMLISVTNFFRDPKAFDKLEREIVPALIQDRNTDDPVRVWCTGCATGEEAYSLAILFSEAVERQGKSIDIKIFATDVDRDALEFASMGVFPENIAADVPSHHINRYFTHKNGKYHISRQIREMIVFAPHNIAKDPPFTRMDLICCRNLLIYLQPALQKKITSLFRFALKPEGYLFLGSSESLGDLSEEFTSVDSKWKLYRLRKNAKRKLPDTLKSAEAATMPKPQLPRVNRIKKRGEKGDLLEHICRILVDSHAKSCVVVNENYQLVYMFGDVKSYVSLFDGEASLDILQLTCRDLSLALSTALTRAAKENKPILYNGIIVPGKEGHQKINVQVNRIGMENERQPFYLILMEEQKTVITDKEIQEHSKASEEISEHVADLENDLQFTRENLQATIEELETSNEELQATNEELLSSNEELQSTNEELQSVNEELFTVNSEYQQKIKEMTELNNDIDNLLRCTDIGSVFLDEGMRITRYTPAAVQYVNLIDNDLGRPFFDLSHRLKYEGFSEDARFVIETRESVEKEVLHMDGRAILVKIFPYLDERRDAKGIIINYVDLSAIKKIEIDLLQMEKEKDIILDTVSDTILYYNDNLEVIWANRAAFHTLGKDPGTLIGRHADHIWENSSPEFDSAPARKAFQDGTVSRHTFTDADAVEWVVKDVPIRDNQGNVKAIVEFGRTAESG